MAGPIMSHQPLPVDRSANRPIYLIVAKDPTVSKTKIQFYTSESITEGSAAIEFRGRAINKAQAEEISKDPYAKRSVGDEVNRKIPWHNVERIDNITYKIKNEAQLVGV
jgi:hypothetical protein